MDKKKQIQFNLNNFLLSTSLALDLLEKDIYKTSNNHAKRVAYISLKIGQEYYLTPEEMFDLCAYCLIHNIALKKENNYDKEHLNIAQEKADKLPFLCSYKNVIKYHREFFDGSGVFGLKEESIPLFSQIISFSHLLDEKFDLSNEDIKNRKKIDSFVEENKDILFSEDIAQRYINISRSTDFYLDMQSENDNIYFIFSTLHDFTITPTFEEVLDYISIFDSLDLENRDFLIKCSKMCDYYNFDHKDKQTFLIAASLHNIGKLAIPQNILNKTSKLKDEEYEIIKAYPYYTKKILNNIMGFNDISKWASRFQECLDGSGYPSRLSAKDLSLKDRLMAVLNVYQALRTKKAYRDEHMHEDSIKIMLELANNSKLDIATVKHLSEQLK